MRKTGIAVFIVWCVFEAVSVLPASGSQFFPCPEKDFFGFGCATEKAATGQPQTSEAPPSAPSASPDLWTETTSDENGQIKTYRPPPIVVNLLDRAADPDPKVAMQAAKEYLRWNHERLQRIQRAQKAVEMAAIEMGIQPDETVPIPLAEQSRTLARAKPDQMLFFFSAQCPYSRQQIPVVQALSVRRPNVRIEGIAMDAPANETARALKNGKAAFRVAMDKGGSAEYGIRSYPVMIFLKNNREVGRYEGYTDLDTLLDAAAGRFDNENASENTQERADLQDNPSRSGGRRAARLGGSCDNVR